MYEDLTCTICDPHDQLVDAARSAVLLDILVHGSDSDQQMLHWYADDKWRKNQFHDACLIQDKDGAFVALCGNRLMPDDSMKILCHLYTIKRYRNRYQSLHQVLMIPRLVQQAKDMCLQGLWYSIHTFDQRHKRFSESQKRLLKPGAVARDHMPYWDRFIFTETIVYNNTEQDKFYMSLID
mgnify:CR=1 FL=1